MFYVSYFIALAVTILSLFIFRKESIFSPFKFMFLINILYILVPITLNGLIGYNIKEFGSVFPSLFSDFSNNYMLRIYIYFNFIILIVRVLFNRVNFKFINNVEYHSKDLNFAIVSVFFLIVGILFIALSITLVGGLDVYSSYSIEATVGGNVVAQSFKSQGELMIGIFSLPLIKYLYKEKRIILLIFFLAFIVGFSLLGGARKFLVFPFCFLVLLHFSDNKASLIRLLKYILLSILSLIILTIVQNVRDGLGFLIDLKSIERSITAQLGFAYLVPNAFIYYNYEILSQLNFSLLNFFRQLLNPIVFLVPRFIYPNKEKLLFSNNREFFILDFHTVGGSSFIEYFLANSMYSLIIFYFILCLLIGYIFKLNQINKNPLFLYLYFSSLIDLIWFNFNLGYVVAMKTFLIQIVLTLFFYYFVYIVLRTVSIKSEPLLRLD